MMKNIFFTFVRQLLGAIWHCSICGFYVVIDRNCMSTFAAYVHAKEQAYFWKHRLYLISKNFTCAFSFVIARKLSHIYPRIRHISHSFCLWNNCALKGFSASCLRLIAKFCRFLFYMTLVTMFAILPMRLLDIRILINLVQTRTKSTRLYIKIQMIWRQFSGTVT